MGKMQNNSEVNTGTAVKSKTAVGKLSNFINGKAMGLAIAVIHIALTFLLLGELLYLNILPVWMFMVICFVVLVICAMSVLMTFGKKKIRAIAKIGV